MFEPVVKPRGLKGAIKWLLLPAVIAVLMDIPLEIDLYRYTRFKFTDPAGIEAIHFWWLYLHARIIGIFSFSMPIVSDVNPWPTFLTKDENSWGMTVINVAFYALVVSWCKYSILDGFTVGFDAARFRDYRPFKVAIVWLVLGCLLIGGVMMFGRHPPDPDDIFACLALAYPGVILTLVTVIIVTGRKIRLGARVDRITI